MAELSRLWYNYQMGIINDPTPGQPIDVNYISRIVTTLNGLTNDFVTKDKQSRVVKARGSSAVFEETRTSNLSFVGGYMQVKSDAKSNNQEVISKQTFIFNRTFQNPPIVTATPQVDSSGIDKDTSSVSIMITQVTKSSVTFSVLFNSKTKNATIGINIIAIGLPASLG
jgi:hypothetical protein